VRDQSGGLDAEVAADGGDERAPVSGGAALLLTTEPREVAAERRQSGEGKLWWWGGENFGRQRRGSLFIGSGGRWNRRGCRWGSGDVADAWRKRGMSRGGPYRPASGLKPVSTHDVRHACVAGRTEGEG
jgi:hypothetical protein